MSVSQFSSRSCRCTGKEEEEDAKNGDAVPLVSDALQHPALNPPEGSLTLLDTLRQFLLQLEFHLWGVLDRGWTGPPPPPPPCQLFFRARFLLAFKCTPWPRGSCTGLVRASRTTARPITARSTRAQASHYHRPAHPHATAQPPPTPPHRTVCLPRPSPGCSTVMWPWCAGGMPYRRRFLVAVLEAQTPLLLARLMLILMAAVRPRVQNAILTKAWSFMDVDVVPGGLAILDPVRPPPCSLIRPLSCAPPQCSLCSHCEGRLVLC